MVEEKKAQLVELGYRIDEGDPAYQIWVMFSYDEATRNLYNQSLAMILGQQFYLQQRQQQKNVDSNESVDSIFYNLQNNVSYADRCPVQPRCNSSQK